MASTHEPSFRKWTLHEEDRFCHLLLTAKAYFNLSDEGRLRKALTITEAEMAYSCRRSEGTITALDMAFKLHDIFDKMKQFKSFLDLDGIYYDGYDNRVTALQPYYRNNVGFGAEPEDYKNWRESGFRNYVGWVDLFEHSGMEYINFPFLKSLIQNSNSAE